MKKYIIAAIILGILCVGIVWATASSSISISLTISGLGSSTTSLQDNFTATEPNAVVRGYRRLTTQDINEVLYIGDISTVEGVLLRSVDYDLQVDCNYVSAFDPDILIEGATSVYFKPVGTVYIRNPSGDANTPLYEYVVFGTR